MPAARKIALSLLLIPLALAVAGCAAAPPLREGRPAVHLQWPSLPAPARIQWVREISDYNDLGMSRGFWSRLSDLLVGEPDYRIVRPYGIYMDLSNRLFVVDTGRSAVHVMDTRDGKFTIIGQEEGVLQTPIGITGDDNDTIYITDSSAGVIYRYRYQENQLQPFGTLNHGRPTGIAYNRTNKLLYVSDTTAHQVVVFDLNGTEKMRIGSRGDGQGRFNFPTDLSIDRTGRLFVTDALNARVQVFTPTGEFITMFGRAGDSSGEMAKPKGIAVDSDGHIYVCDALIDSVQIFNEAGTLLLDFGGHGSEPGQFWMPSGLFIDHEDYIFVADTYNNRIQVFRYFGGEIVPQEKNGEKD